MRTPEGNPIPPNTLDEIKRDMERRRLICGQIRRIEQERVKRLEQAPDTDPNAMVHLLARVTGIGVETADTLVREVLTRNLRDRRAVARYGGLTGAPNQSGSFSRQRGLARSGKARHLHHFYTLVERIQTRTQALTEAGLSKAREFNHQRYYFQGIGRYAPDAAYARGLADPEASYSHALPGYADARSLLAAPVAERLFFAGEACSPHDFSTAHGAWRSGIAAAEAAIAAMAKQ